MNFNKILFASIMTFVFIIFFLSFIIYIKNHPDDFNNNNNLTKPIKAQTYVPRYISKYIPENPMWIKKTITYNINSCNKRKSQIINDDFKLIKTKTNISLNFQQINNTADINFICENNINIASSMGDGYYVGGASTINSNNNVISSAKIELLNEYANKDDMLILHEILHTLGIEHSKNDESVMYPILYDKQGFDKETIKQLQELYK